MVVGITGHQEREGINWAWVRRTLTEEMKRLDGLRGLSSLAAGSDQVFAEVLLFLGASVTAIIPLQDYDKFFKGQSLVDYHSLVGRCDRVDLDSNSAPELAFLEAGLYIVEHSDLLVAVWDGQAADGVGGTADIVGYAAARKKPIVHLNPCSESVVRR